MDHPDFIEVFDDALSAEQCRTLIEAFDSNKNHARGATGGGVNLALKDSWDICISDDPRWKQVEAALNGAMLRGLLAYLRKYPYTILAPVWLRMQDPATGAATTLDPGNLATLDDPRLTTLALKAFRPGAINIQKYLADEGGYPRWHCEIYPDRRSDVLNRTLLWTLYLNDDFEEGETEFFHQRRKIAPKTGSLLIAPAGFTHTHRGNMPKGAHKYIATSWVLFQNAETLYGTQAATRTGASA